MELGKLELASISKEGNRFRVRFNGPDGQMIDFMGPSFPKGLEIGRTYEIAALVVNEEAGEPVGPDKS